MLFITQPSPKLFPIRNRIIDYTIAEIFLEQTPELLETESQAI